MFLYLLIIFYILLCPVVLCTGMAKLYLVGLTQFFFCSLHWRNLSFYNKITTTHFKQIRFWWKNVIKFRGKVYSNFFKFVQLFFFECRVTFLSLHKAEHSSQCSVWVVLLWFIAQKYIQVWQLSKTQIQFVFLVMWTMHVEHLKMWCELDSSFLK